MRSCSDRKENFQLKKKSKNLLAKVPSLVAAKLVQINDDIVDAQLIWASDIDKKARGNYRS